MKKGLLIIGSISFAILTVVVIIICITNHKNEFDDYIGTSSMEDISKKYQDAEIPNNLDNLQWSIVTTIDRDSYESFMDIADITDSYNGDYTIFNSIDDREVYVNDDNYITDMYSYSMGEDDIFCYYVISPDGTLYIYEYYGE